MYNDLKDFLLAIGSDVSAEAIIHSVKFLFRKKNTTDIQQFKQALKEISIKDSHVDSLVEFLADNGAIEIKGVTIVARDIIAYRSEPNANISIGPGTVSSTASTTIKVGGGEIKISGKSSIIQKN